MEPNDTVYVSIWTRPCFSSNFLSSAVALNAFILTLNSKPIRMINELIKIKVPNAMIVPIEPYKILYLSKLLRKAEKPSVAIILNEVAMIAPGETSFHLFGIDGAYL